MAVADRKPPAAGHVAASDRSGGTAQPRRSELIDVASPAADRVLRIIAERSERCGACGADRFRVGYALYLGFLFLDECEGTYLVGLTCRNPSCPHPRSGIRLQGSDFLQ